MKIKTLTLKCRYWRPGTDYPATITERVKKHVEQGDIIAVSEKAISTATNNIVLPGFVAHEDKSAIISGATSLIFPSLYEGFGFPVLEANACGVPVICSDTSSLPEIAGDAAYLVDPLDTDAIAQAIRDLIDQSELQQRLVINGSVNARRFTWTTCAAQVMDTLESAI